MSLINEIRKETHATEPVIDPMLIEKSAGSAYISSSSRDEGIPDPQGMEDWIDLYRKAAFIYAGISAISRVIANLGFVLEKKTVGEGGSVVWENVPQHDILDLLADPNSAETQYDMIEALSVYLDTAGTGYWEASYKQGSKVPNALYNMRPSRVEVVPTRDGKAVKKYIYQTKKGGKRTIFSPEEVIPFKYFNPLNDWVGMGTIQPAINEIQLDSNMLKWNKEFFKKGTIEGILHTDKTLTAGDLKGFQDMWKEAQQRDSRNTPILGKNVQYTPIGKSPTDVDFLKGRADNRTAMISTIGTPPIKVGVLDQAQYDNYYLQEEDFNRNTIVPRCKKISGALTKFLVPLFPDLVGKGYRIEFDTSRLLKEDLNRKTDRIRKQIEAGLLTPNEGRQELGRLRIDAEGGDKLYMDKRFYPIEIIEEIANQEANKLSTDPKRLQDATPPAEKAEIVT